MIYLIHFESPLHHAQHYIGYAEDIDKRLKRHGTSGGSNLLRAVTQQGISYKIVRTWQGGRQEERQLKRQKNAARYCPICAQKSFEKEVERKAGRVRVVGASTIRLTPNPKYVQYPKPLENINRKRVIDLNKYRKK